MESKVVFPFIGVDVFFVISGFLITRILNHEFQETGKINFKRFYVRRIRRLMPTLFLTIFLTFILTFLAFSPSDFINTTKSMLMSSVALSNFHFLSIADYFDTSSNFKPLLHTWSLGIEEQFYLLYPITLFLLLKLFKNKGKNNIIITLTTLFLLSLFYTFYSSKQGIPNNFANLFLPEDNISSSLSSLQFYLLPFRMFEFLTGAIIALLKSPNIKSEYLKLALNFIGLTIIFMFGIIISKDTPYLATLNVLPCFGAGILLFFPPSKFLSFFFTNRFLILTGQISYTLYLIHWLLIVIYRYLFDGDFSLFEQLGLFIVMYLLSFIIYKYYETPLRYKKSNFSIKSNKSLVYILVINILIVFIIKQNVNYEDGWLWRLSDKNLALIEKIGVPKDFHKKNWGGAGYKNGWLGENPKEEGAIPDMIWLGDSHAGHFRKGLDSLFVKKRHKKIYFQKCSSSLRLPDIIVNLTETTKETSKEQFDIDYKFILKYPNTPVVLSHHWLGQMHRSDLFNHSTGKYEKIDSTEWELLAELLAEKIVKFHQMSGINRKFVIIGDTPNMAKNKLNYIDKLLRPKYLRGVAPIKSVFPHNRIKFNSFFESYFSAIENITFIDPSKALCKEGNCLKQKNDKIYYSDTNHLSKDGSLLVVEYLQEELLSILEGKR